MQQEILRLRTVTSCAILNYSLPYQTEIYRIFKDWIISAVNRNKIKNPKKRGKDNWDLVEIFMQLLQLRHIIVRSISESWFYLFGIVNSILKE